ncbi:hypothetical protein OG21DRAFT_1483827 [Imleria badia]|nr:hypothetical protein OG21DRAFT_1483827 [Imleria badia]
MHSDPHLFIIESPPAPPPPGFFPEDVSLYKGPPLPCTQNINRGSSMASPGAICGPTECTTAELMAAREHSILHACAPILPSKLPETDETKLMLWCLALARKQSLVVQLANIQLDCEELESDVVDRLGEEVAEKTLSKIYNLGDAHSHGAKGRLISSISNITYKSVEILAP